MKALARKKKAEEGGIKSDWIATFADLMNLLLCFFILLFAFSSVDAEKFEKVSISMANSIGVFEGGSTSFGTQELISGGVSQLNDLSEFLTSMGNTVKGEDNPTDTKDSDSSMQGGTGAEGVIDQNENEEGIQGSLGGKTTDDIKETDVTEGSDTKQSDSTEDVQEALETIEGKMSEVTTEMYDEASDLSDDYGLGDYVELSMDPDSRYIQLTLSGSILFESGSADIKTNASKILRNVGDIMKAFEGYQIEITGHTDSVPMSSSTFKDNNWLSSARALNTADFLIKQCDIDPKLLKYSGRGEYEPISSNATAEGRARNRRIEIKIYNEYSGG